MNKHKLLALLTALAILIGNFALPVAQAEVVQKTYSISLTSMNEDGGNELFAVPVPNSENNEYWVQLGPQDDINHLMLTIQNTEHPEYSFLPNNGALLEGLVDADGALTGSSYPIQVMIGDQIVETILLYVSIYPMPEETEPSSEPVPGESAAPAEEPSEEPVAPVEEPSTPQVVPASVEVRYQDEKGNVLASDNFLAESLGTNHVNVNYALIPQGYILVDSDSKTVELQEGGIVNPTSIVFTLQAEKPALGADVEVNYHNKTTGEVFANEKIHITELGTTTIYANTDLLPQGFVIEGESSAVVELYNDNTLSQSTVDFYAIEETKEPEIVEEPTVNPVTIPVKYIDEDTKQELQPAEQVLIDVQGGKTVTANKTDFENYTLTSAAEQTVYLMADGYVEPNEVVFTFKADTPAEEPAAPVEEPSEVEEPGASETGEEIPAENPQTENLGKAKVNADNINVRKQPTTGKAGEIITKLSTGEEVTILEYVDKSGENWAKINFTFKGATKTGYIMSKYLTVDAPAPGEEVPNTEEPTEPATNEETPNTPAVNVELKVQYMDGETSLYEYTESLTGVGEHTIQVRNVQETAAYDLKDEMVKTVSVDANGAVSTNPLVFQFAKKAVAATVNVHYVDETGNKIAEDIAMLYESEGAFTLEPQQNVEGFHLLEPKSYEVFVQATGEVSPSDVSFKYKKAEVQGMVTIHYVDTDAKSVAEDTVQTLNSVGTHTITPNFFSSQYDIEGKTSYDVELKADGTLTLSEITFTYRKKATPVSAVLTIHYIDEEGSKIVESTTQSINTVGAQNISPNAIVPSNFTIVGATTQSVTLGADGTLTPAEITFQYKEVPDPNAVVNAVVVVKYVDANYASIAESDVIRLNTLGKQQVTPVKNIEGYVLRNKTENVEVINASSVTPDEVIFVYDKVLPKNPEAIITIHYVDENGTPIVQSTQQQINTVGNNTIVARPQNLPADYQLTGNNQVVVQLNQDGTVSQNPVIFVYKNTKDDFEHYRGYAITNANNTALRKNANNNANEVLQTMPRDTLLYVYGQVKNNGILYHSVNSVGGAAGYVTDADITKITDAEAQKYLEAYKPAPTPVVPAQTGYAMTLGMNVPFRQFASGYSQMISELYSGTVVFLNGQVEYNEGYAWFVAQYNNKIGYIRSDQLRMLSQQEAANYLKNITQPQPSATIQAGFDGNALSSYGYVNAGDVNFRSQASVKSAAIGKIKRYGLGLIKETKQVDGVTWYKINYNGKEGYVQGNYFKPMTMNEFNNFLKSEEYKRGLANNATQTTSNITNLPKTDAGFAAPGKVQTVEDYNTTKWKNPNLASVSYEPFRPDITPMPTYGLDISTTPEPSMLPDSSAPVESITPFPTEEINPVTEKTTGGSPLFAIFGITLLGVTGAAGYAVYAKNKRAKMIARAKARQQAQTQGKPVNAASTSNVPYGNVNTGNTASGSSFTTPSKNNAAPFTQRKPLQEDYFKKPTVTNTSSSQASNVPNMDTPQGTKSSTPTSASEANTTRRRRS